MSLEIPTSGTNKGQKLRLMTEIDEMKGQDTVAEWLRRLTRTVFPRR